MISIGINEDFKYEILLVMGDKEKTIVASVKEFLEFMDTLEFNNVTCYKMLRRI